MRSSRLVLNCHGKPVVYTPKDGEPDDLQAVVSDFGQGRAPTGWDEELFPGRARHAAFRFHPEDMDALPNRGATVLYDDEEFGIQEAVYQPPFGEPVWIVCRASAAQSGVFR